jgi:hypothetical protein
VSRKVYPVFSLGDRLWDAKEGKNRAMHETQGFLGQRWESCAVTPSINEKNVQKPKELIGLMVTLLSEID